MPTNVYDAHEPPLSTYYGREIDRTTAGRPVRDDDLGRPEQGYKHRICSMVYLHSALVIRTCYGTGLFLYTLLPFSPGVKQRLPHT